MTSFLCSLWACKYKKGILLIFLGLFLCFHDSICKKFEKSHVFLWRPGKFVWWMGANPRFLQILPEGLLKRYLLYHGINQYLFYWLLMHSHDLLVKKFWLHIISAHIWDSAFHSILCPFTEFVLIDKWLATRAGSWESHSFTSCLFVVITITWAVLWLWLSYGLCHIMLPCIWAVLNLFMFHECSCVLGFLHDLKLILGNTRVK